MLVLKILLFLQIKYFHKKYFVFVFKRHILSWKVLMYWKDICIKTEVKNPIYFKVSEVPEKTFCLFLFADSLHHCQ